MNRQVQVLWMFAAIAVAALGSAAAPELPAFRSGEYSIADYGATPDGS